ncbi:hypothetical protein BSKO_04389 [Bryopsis sp. KO-2023]|nr:hypothetical protein BSKO_04389 [Bryopsis sp. KO-2023]
MLHPLTIRPALRPCVCIRRPTTSRHGRLNRSGSAAPIKWGAWSSGRRHPRFVLVPCVYTQRGNVRLQNEDLDLDNDVFESWENDGHDVEQIGMDLLGWKELCLQVASFCSTPMAAQSILDSGAAIGKTRKESERMLEETSEAVNAGLDFQGILDVSPIVKADRNRSFTPLQLNGIASTLEGGFRLLEKIESQDLPKLRDLAKGISKVDTSITEAIRYCIREDGYILDQASKTLAEVREKRIKASNELTEMMNDWAQSLYKQKAAERAIVVIRRDRLCIPVKVNMRSQVPKGSVALAMSASGQTVYIEPKPAVALNNTAALLESEETEEIERLLSALTLKVLDNVDNIEQLLASIEQLDLVNARGRHARWMSSTRPGFLPDDGKGIKGFQLKLQGARHPILLEPSLARLPTPPSAIDAPFSSDFQTVSLDSQRVQPPTTTKTDENSEKPEPPRPLNLQIPAGKSVVALTGPNTGGKTATLKALGVLSIMAKAGLFVPVHDENESQTFLPWFDKVLVDIGDGQSLQQSLSTFSGHITRINKVFENVSSQSLVLLDELGSGTDPCEGSALASVILTKLSQKSKLTLATTHHAEIKDMAELDPLFMNASMEFDKVNLKPTYKLLWGSAGQSNALDISEALGFDGLIVKEARKILQREQSVAETSGDVRSFELEHSLKQKLAEAKDSAETTQTQKDAAFSKLELAREEVKRLKEVEKTLRDKLGKSSDLPVKLGEEVNWILGQVQCGEFTRAEAESCFKEIESSMPKPSTSVDEEVWAPSVGETVKILNMGGKLGKVVSIKSANLVEILMGQLTFTSAPWQLEPLTQKESRIREDRERRSIQEEMEEERKAKEESREPQEDSGRETVFIQTSANTVDVRGEVSDDAIESVGIALGRFKPGEVCYIVHGRGTGKLRDSVRLYLARNKRVESFHDESESAGGCTVAVLK